MIKYECPVQLNILYFFLFHKKALNILTTVLYSSSFVLCFWTVFYRACRVNICHLVSFSTPKSVSVVERTFRCRPCSLIIHIVGCRRQRPLPFTRVFVSIQIWAKQVAIFEQNIFWMKFVKYILCFILGHICFLEGYSRFNSFSTS